MSCTNKQLNLQDKAISCIKHFFLQTYIQSHRQFRFITEWRCTHPPPLFSPSLFLLHLRYLYIPFSQRFHSMPLYYSFVLIHRVFSPLLSSSSPQSDTAQILHLISLAIIYIYNHQLLRVHSLFTNFTSRNATPPSLYSAVSTYQYIHPLEYLTWEEISLRNILM